MRPLLAALCAMAAVVVAAPAASAADTVRNPTVRGPVTGGVHGYPWGKSLYKLRGRSLGKRFHYTEREYFFRGTAGERSTGASAPYESRMLVRLPRNRKKFKGTVIVEWLNVTSQLDLETAWPVEAQYLMRNGIGYVGVSAQVAGICCGPTTLKGWDPTRYAPLLHPGDPFSHDIFSQAIRALRAPGRNLPAGPLGRRVDPMRGMRVRDIAVTGASQSAIYLTQFVNRGYNRGQVDVYVITRGGGPFRDFSTPIFHVNEENTDAPQPDNSRYRAWEEAGTSHAPEAWWRYIARQERRDMASSALPDSIDAACAPVNRGSIDYTGRAMSRWVSRYLRTGRMPPRAPRVRRNSNNAILRNRHGLARGGLRQPFVQVPVGFNTSDGCFLYGAYKPWSAKRIRSLYRTHRGYVRRVRRYSRRAVRRGWLLPADRRDVLRKARRFKAPWRGRCSDACRAPLGL